MTEEIITHVNAKIKALDMFADLRGLCDIIEKVQGEDITVSFPAEYTGNDKYNHIDKATQFEDGILWHRLIGEITDEDSEEESAYINDPQIRRTFPLRAIFILPKTVFRNGKDDQYTEEKAIHNIANSINNEDDIILNASLQVEYSQIRTSGSNRNKLEVFDDEFENVKFNVSNKFMMCYINYNVSVESMLSCFENYKC